MTDQKRDEFFKKLRKESPIPCDFKLGDKVTFTNVYGVAFPGKTIIGFADDDSFYGRIIHLDKDCYWFPSHPKELTLEKPAS